jgi:hypothetical protein
VVEQLEKKICQAVHIFHDQTAAYNEIIDDLPVKEMEARQKNSSSMKEIFMM